MLPPPPFSSEVGVNIKSVHSFEELFALVGSTIVGLYYEKDMDFKEHIEILLKQRGQEYDVFEHAYLYLNPQSNLSEAFIWTKTDLIICKYVFGAVDPYTIFIGERNPPLEGFSTES